MTMPPACWAASLDELVGLAGDGTRALIPIVERARMPWKEPDAYDDWDHMCRAVYRSIVIMSVENAEGVSAFLPVSDYDRRVGSYKECSFICDAKSRDGMAFVCFETEETPFDRCLFALLDGESNVIGDRRLARSEVKFGLAARDRNTKALEFFDELNVFL